MKEELFGMLDEARAKAHIESMDNFHVDMTVKELESNRSKCSLDKTSGNKDDLVASYRLQYVALQLQRRRQAFMKTKKRFKELKKFLPWYRVLYASYRRIHYLTLQKYKDDE